MLNSVQSVESALSPVSHISVFSESWIDADLIWEACDPSQNMHRFYRVSWRASLLSPWTVKRSWGRIGSTGRSTLCVCDSFEEAGVIVSRLVLLRARRPLPYRLVFSRVLGSPFEKSYVLSLIAGVVESVPKDMSPIDVSLIDQTPPYAHSYAASLEYIQ